ncbi:hypothetical protein Q3O60_07000 [Alkalimonas collagenimarina]|uniref:Transmembrane protein n=1 Tax=Alkalimonas collagenimarina TaxID=400390 RepID=A0ABT9GYI9_9GAMM|nr:hypothetical protein [Alkalimonas collagenimarina]MDP4535929.1 hypothetical protein [Alkalimonas collagenimarina]
MHTIMVLAGGLLLLAACLLLGYWRQAIGLAALCFIPIWFMVAAVNMWVGVTKAGYTFMQEVPFFLLVFLPLAAAALLIWRYAK